MYHRYWEVSRQQSDKMCFMHPSKFEPLAVSYTPRWLVDLFPGLGGTRYAARPESNREKLRDVLLDALAEHGNATVHFDTAVLDIREIPGDGGSTAEVRLRLVILPTYNFIGRCGRGKLTTHAPTRAHSSWVRMGTALASTIS